MNDILFSLFQDLLNQFKQNYNFSLWMDHCRDIHSNSIEFISIEFSSNLLKPNLHYYRLRINETDVFNSLLIKFILVTKLNRPQLFRRTIYMSQVGHGKLHVFSDS